MVSKNWIVGCVFIVSFIIILEYQLSLVQHMFQAIPIIAVDHVTTELASTPTSTAVTTELDVAITSTSTTTSVSTPKNATKHILVWNNYFQIPHFGLGGTGEKPFKDFHCPVSNCAITDRTTDALRMPYEEYDAVLFHVYYMNQQLPRKRKPHQRYVFFLLESPQTVSVKSFPVYKDYFNWTMTYRRDSDIWRPYGWLSDRMFTQGEIPPATDLHLMEPQFDSDRVINVSGKKYLAAWFVSHCNVKSKRDEYVRQLSKYIPVHIFGRCGDGKHTCPQNSMQCYEMLEQQYKFYLSFENSLCRDYVTEKVFYVIRYNVVPVVYGGANYTQILPPMSYIDASDFNNPKELADYLLYLDKNPNEYRKYFWWKDYYRIYTWHSYIVCKLCDMLNNSSLPNKVYPNIREWWDGPGVCHLPEDHFKEKFLTSTQQTRKP